MKSSSEKQPTAVYEPPETETVLTAARISEAPTETVGSEARSRTGVVPGPIVLQRCAPRVVRTHRNRGIIRWSVLILSDVGSFLLARFLVLQFRDAETAGAPIATVLRNMLPPGSLRLGELMVAIFVGLLAFRTYGAGHNRRNVRTLLAASSAGLLLVCFDWLWSAFSWYHALGCLAMLVGIGAVLVLERKLIDAAVQNLRGVRNSAPRTVVVGPAASARRILLDSAFNDPVSFALVGYVDSNEMAAADALGHVSGLVQVIDHHRVETLILCGECQAATTDDVFTLADTAGCAVFITPSWARVRDLAPRLVWQRSVPLIALTRPELRGQQLVLKRAVDVAVAALALVALSPLLLLVATAVRLTSPGPVFFRQVRVGLGGRHFRIFKFRTMEHNAELRRTELLASSLYSDARLFKIRHDPRVTAIGRILRRTSLDELPQFWNVLRGEMSVVGPRPPIPSEVSLYNEHHYSRFNMKPGITGPWQVSGRNGIEDFESVVRIENDYMRNWTFWKDVEILLRTMPAVLSMKGAH